MFQQKIEQTKNRWSLKSRFEKKIFLNWIHLNIHLEIKKKKKEKRKNKISKIKENYKILELLIDRSLLHTRFLKLSTSIRNLFLVEAEVDDDDDNELLVPGVPVESEPMLDMELLRCDDDDVDDENVNLLLNTPPVFLAVGDEDEDEELS